MSLERCVRVSELTGPRLKKALGLKRAIKTGHNLHKDHSGNFGFVLVKHAPGKRNDEDWFTLSGEHDASGCVTKLRAGGYAIGTPWSNVDASSYTDAIQRIKSTLR